MDDSRQPSTAPLKSTSAKDADSTARPSATASGSLNIHAVGTFPTATNPSLPIIAADLDDDALFEERPWRRPGADLTDYFNFGFDEGSWKEYCQKQKVLREEHGGKRRIQNVFEAMASGGGASGGFPPMMPPMPFQMPPPPPWMMMPPPHQMAGIPPPPPSMQHSTGPGGAGSRDRSRERRRRDTSRDRSRTRDSKGGRSEKGREKEREYDRSSRHGTSSRRSSSPRARSSRR